MDKFLITQISRNSKFALLLVQSFPRFSEFFPRNRVGIDDPSVFVWRKGDSIREKLHNLLT